MKNVEDIFSESQKPSCGVPEGYFDSLKTRLVSIPSQGSSRSGVLLRLKPYLALAACFVVAAVIGHAVLKSTAGGGESEMDYSDLVYSELMPVTQSDALYIITETERDEVSEEDIINYLIESGVSSEQLAYIEH